MVYESLGHIWYEISTDNGTNWKLMGPTYQGTAAPAPLDNGGGKLPSIDYCVDDGTTVAIAFQQKIGTTSSIVVQYYTANGNDVNYFWTRPPPPGLDQAMLKPILMPRATRTPIFAGGTVTNSC